MEFPSGRYGRPSFVMQPDNQLDAEPQSGADARPNHQVVSRLLQRVADGATSAELVEILKVDPVLTYALLTEFSSTGAVLAKYVTSCKRAIENMGPAALTDWLTAALPHATKVTQFSDKIRNTLIRARFMELMGEPTKAGQEPENRYLVGLFSRLDELLDVPLPELILPMPFPEEMRSAILEQAGRLGRLLKFAQTIEQADEPGMDFMQTNLHLPAIQVYDAYNEADEWVAAMERQYTSSN